MRILILVLCIVVSVILIGLYYHAAAPQTSSQQPVPRVRQRNQHLADGCFHVFLDVGANVGVHGRFLLEPHKYPLVPQVHAMFNQYFGAQRDNRDICSFEVEANPNQYPKIQTKVDAYAKMGWRYHLVKAAASDHDGTLTFWHNNNLQPNASDHFEEWSFGMKKRTPNAKREDVTVMRFSDWILREIAPRRIPTQLYGNYSTTATNPAPRVVMKMDIEGSEYVVLPDLIATGAACHVDLIFGEGHGRLTPFYFEAKTVNQTTSPEGVPTSTTTTTLPPFSVTSANHSSALLSSFATTLGAARNCKTKFQEFDTEQYLKDGIPLPTP